MFHWYFRRSPYKRVVVFTMSPYSPKVSSSGSVGVLLKKTSVSVWTPLLTANVVRVSAHISTFMGRALDLGADTDEEDGERAGGEVGEATGKKKAAVGDEGLPGEATSSATELASSSPRGRWSAEWVANFSACFIDLDVFKDIEPSLMRLRSAALSRWESSSKSSSRLFSVSSLAWDTSCCMSSDCSRETCFASSKPLVPSFPAMPPETPKRFNKCSLSVSTFTQFRSRCS
mmetsp:Transcript_57898/g.188235  ORF Transcript_57898/g.188235 Transcript_57898/m.188235 type:complete len:231 (+) Transcript_57898:2345-3037(+)